MPWPSIDGAAIRGIPWGSLRIRLTLLNTAAVLLAMFILILAVRFGVRSALFRNTDTTLMAEVREIALALHELDDRSLVVDSLRRKAESHYGRNWFVQLLDGPDSTVWASENCPDAVRNHAVDETMVETVRQLDGYRWARRRINESDSHAMYVRIGMPVEIIEREVDGLLWFLLPIGLAFTLLTPLAGYWLALRATRPIAGILRTAERLRPTKLGDRLDTRGTMDELDQLSSTINRLLDQVALHVEQQQQFVADAAHELRGPLSAIQNSLEVAGAKARTPEEYQLTVEEVLDETRHLSKLANDLLLLAEVGNSLGSVFNEVCDIDEVVRQTSMMFSGVAEERSITVEYRSPGPVTVRGDKRQLRQVASNLVDNAIRFTPEGGKVCLSVTTDRGNAVVAVKDTGRGVDPEQIPKVFDRFFQADAARDRSDIGRGGGLGLSICRSIVERHGGRIALESEGLGKGATVTVRIPLFPRPA